MTGQHVAASGLRTIIHLFDMRYEYDTNGRMSGVKGEGILPQFVLGRAAEGCLWRFRADLDPERVKAVSRLASREPGFPIAGETPAPPPERLVMIERLLSADASPVATRHELLTREGVEPVEVWTIE